MVKPVAFSELGKAAKDVLVGGGTAAYQFNQTVSISSTTADNLNVVMTATKKDGALDMALKSTYTAPKYTLVSTFSQAGKLGLTATFKDLAPGLTLGASHTCPDADWGSVKCPITGIPLPPVKISADYSVDRLTLKSAVALAAAPTLDVAVTTGVDKLTLGADVQVDLQKAAPSKWTVGAGYAAGDFQAAVFLNDKNVVTGRYAHSVTSTATLGTEVTHDLTSKNTTFSAGLSKSLDRGTVFKARLDNTGLVSVLYEQEVRAKTKMGLSAQFDALALDKPPKLGFAYDLKY